MHVKLILCVYIFVDLFFVCFDLRVVLSCSTPLSRSTIFTEALPIKPDDSSVFNFKAIVYSRVSRFGLAVRRYAGKRKDLGSIPLRLSFLFRKVVVCGHYWNIKWLSSLSILIQVSFWWWQCSDRYILSPPPPYPLPPFSPSLISLMVSVDVKHHVYFSQGHHGTGELWIAERSVRAYSHNSRSCPPPPPPPPR